MTSRRLIGLVIGFAVGVTTSACLDDVFRRTKENCAGDSSVAGCVAQDASTDAATDAGRDAATDSAVRECQTDSQCSSRSAGRCDTSVGRCVACTASAQCGHFSDTKVCEAGACVQCTIATEATACAGKSCNPATKVCTTTAVATVTACGACVADSECVTDHKCVTLAYSSFPGKQGNYCLPAQGAGCARPFFNLKAGLVSLSGLAASNYCAPVDFTTCEAVLQHRTQQGSCSGGVSGTPEMFDSACGLPAVADGLCRSAGGTRCTYQCGNDDDCPMGFACAGSPTKYCGI